jgi:hypothetical protein
LRKALSINKANYPIFWFMQCFPLEKRVLFIQFFLLRKVLSISQSHLFFSVTSLYIHIYISAYPLYPNNTFTALDAKEKLRTRQINAREGKQLKRFNQTLDRAYTVLTKRQDWEKNHIEQDLHIIQLKTPSLEKSLKRESDAENNQNKRLPLITTSSNSLIKSRLSGKSGSSSGSSTHRTTSVRHNNTFLEF